MTWQDVTSGRFVDWGAPKPLAHIDPYLVWAAATGFIDHGGLPTEKVPALIELASPCTGQQLQAEAGPVELFVPPAFLQSRVCSVTIGPGFLALVRTNAKLGAMVLRVELALPVASARTPLAAGSASLPPRRKPLPGTQTGRTVLGVIDDGCAFAHAGLRRSGGPPWTTRVIWLWDQDEKGPSFGAAASPPPSMGYGREASGSTLQVFMTAATSPAGVLDEDACYAAAGYHALRRRATHGMYVLDVATGPVRPAQRMNPAGRPSAQAPGQSAPEVIFVQLPGAALSDPSGGWLAAQVTDGVRYILDRAPADASRIVVNLSYGSRVGPHDGSSTLEAALLEMLDEEPALEIVLPAGNFFADRAHAVLELPGAGPSAAVQCFVPPGSELPVFVELWLSADASGVEVNITPPSAPPQASGFIAAGTAKAWPANGEPACTVVYPEQSSLSSTGTCVLVAFAPTAQRGGMRVPAPAGRWTIELQAQAATTVHGYIARSDADFGMPRRGGRPFFVPDENYDPRRHLRSATDDLAPFAPGPASNVQRRGTLAWNAEHRPGSGQAARLHLVSGYVQRTLGPLPTNRDVPAPYSSAGPGRAVTAPAPAPAPATRAGPDASLPSDRSPVQRGLRAAGTRSASTVTLVGTSSAAPQFARLLVEGVSTAPIPTTPTYPAPDPARFGDGRVSPP